MKLRSVKANFVFNAVRVLSTAIIGILMMPYINKVLESVNLGKVEYANTIVNYFVIFSGLGIPIYGIREIAKNRNNQNKRTLIVCELLIILFLTSVFSYVILFGILFNFSGLSSYKDLLLILSSMILLTNVGAEWYFQGMEDQKFITIRFLIVRIVTLILLFVFVKVKEDYYWYGLILVLNVCGSNLFNLFYLAKDLNISGIQFKDLDIKRHIRPILTIFVATISINIYLQLDILMIGSLVGDKYVGLYTVSNKLVRFVISFITIIGAVLLPRLTSLYASDYQEYKSYLKKAFDIIFIVALPCTVLFLSHADSVIKYMAGDDFVEAILTIKILSPLCLVVGMAYFLGYLVFYVQNKESVYTKAVIISAVFSISVNFWVIQHYYQNGAAVVAVLSELLAIIYMMYAGRNILKEIEILDFNFFKILIATAFFAVIIYICSMFLNNTFFQLLLSLLISATSFIGALIVFKERNCIEFYERLKKVL